MVVVTEVVGWPRLRSPLVGMHLFGHHRSDEGRERAGPSVRGDLESVEEVEGPHNPRDEVV
jgi:hypothetical protein